MVIIFGIALLTNVDWSRNRVEAVIGSTMHRQVHLGRLSWLFGIHGAALQARDLRVYDSDGTPFLTGGRTEIGIALRPLISGQLKLRYVEFHEPELWAVQVRPGVWNFDDLLQTAFDLNFLRTYHGKIHLTDKSSPPTKTFPDIVLEDFNGKLVQPKRLANRPFQLAFKVSQNGYVTAVDVSGVQLCRTQNWRTDKCKLKLHVTNFDPASLHSIASLLNIDLTDTVAWLEKKHLSGLFEVEGSADGTFDQHFKSDLTLKAKNLSFLTTDLGMVSVPNLESSFKLRARDHVLSWTKSTIKLPNSRIEAKTEGKITDWPNLKDGQASGKISALVDDLGQLASILPQTESLPSAKLRCLGRAKGQALVDAQFISSSTGDSLVTKLKAKKVSVSGLEQLLQEEKVPMLTLLGLGDGSQLTGEILLNSGKQIEYKDCTAECSGTIYKFSGYSNYVEQKGHMDFAIKDYNLKQSSDAFNKSANNRQLLSNYVKLCPKCTFLLAGRANVSGSMDQKQADVQIKGEMAFKDARVSISSPKFSFDRVTGSVRTEPDKFVLHQLAGFVDGGRLEISGNLPKKTTGVMDIHLKANNFDLVYLNSLMRMFQIQAPLFARNQLSGPVKEMSLDLSGTPAKPIVQFVVVPKELEYEPPALANSLKATSGTITYRNDRLELKDVGFALKGGPVTASLSIANLGTNARLEKIKIKSDGTDLKDAHYYLTSSLSPEVLKHLYLNFIDSYKLSGMHGKVYGDITCTLGSGNKTQIDGLLGFINAGGKIGEAKQPVEHVSGVLVASGQQLLLQGLSGAIHNSQFELDARIHNYQDLDPRWSGELRADINPHELSQWITLLGSGDLMTGRFRLTAAGPLSLKAKLTGHSQTCSGSFNLAANPEDRMSVTGPFGVLHQPPGEKLVCDGQIKIDQRLVKVTDAHLLLGSSALVGEGSISKPATSDSSTAKQCPADSDVSLMIRSPDSVSLKSVIGLLDPELASEEVSGSIKGFVCLKGKLSEPTVSSELSFDHVCFPQFNLANCAGTLVTVEPQRSGDDNRGIAGKLKLQSCLFGKFHLSNLASQVEWIPSVNNLKAPKIVLSNCKATIANGHFSGNGWMDLDEHTASLKASLRDAKASQLIEEFTDRKDEISGTLDADANIETFGDDLDKLVNNIDGEGTITISKGVVPGFGTLTTRINQGNLVHQGLFGFNFNNVLQSVAPVRTGGFRKIETAFRMDRGHVSVDKLRYDGDDMKLSATGQANTRLHTLELQIEGKIPRVSNSVIGGPFGGLSREFTVQKVMDSITLHKLEGLPSLPVLGDIASAKPNVFTFKVLAPYDQPKLVSQSIEKSFRWVQHRSAQTVHTTSDMQQFDEL
jgi:hypothetical protein